MKKKFSEKFSEIEDFLFEQHECICCNRECDLDNKYKLCSRCVDKIPFIGKHYCLKCGDAIGLDYDYCIKCKSTSYNFDYARSVFSYTDFTAPIILRFKYNGYKNYAKQLAHLLKDFYEESDIISNVVTYVPMPKEREKERGYNQSRELCEEFSKLTDLQMMDFLLRKENTKKQATLNASERKKNIKDSFSAINKSQIKGKDILIIDDVITTGSTTSECAKVLKAQGARSVIVLTVAKTSIEKTYNDKNNKNLEIIRNFVR